MNRLEPTDVIATYPSAECEEKFWLFMVTKVHEQKVDGRWFERKGSNFIMERVDTILTKSIMRLSVDFDCLFVLRKHDVSDEFYCISNAVEKMLQREHDSLLNPP